MVGFLGRWLDPSEQVGPGELVGTLGSPAPLHLLVLLPTSPSTIVVEPGCTASLTRFGDISIAIGSGPPCPVGPHLDPVQLSIFSHRFMSIAGGARRLVVTGWECREGAGTFC